MRTKRKQCKEEILSLNLDIYKAMISDCYDRAELLSLDDSYDSLVAKPLGQVNELSRLIDKAGTPYGKTLAKTKAWGEIARMFAKAATNLQEALAIIEVVDVSKPKKIEKTARLLKDNLAENTKIIRRLKVSLEKRVTPK